MSIEPRIFTPSLRDLSEPDATWGHDLIWFCDAILGEPMSPYQEWLSLHALEVLTKDKALEFAMLEDDPLAEIKKIDRLYAKREVRGGRPIPNGRLRFTKIVILISRQNGKTDWVKKLIKWALFRKRLPEVMAAAQTLNKSMALWKGIKREVEQHPKLAKQLGKPVLLNGSQELWTKDNRGRYRPVGIDENAGRGDTVDLLYIDELRTQKDFVGVNALEATTTVPDNGLIVTTSNAGSAHSVVLRDYRRLAMRPIEDRTWADTRQGLFEWSADPMADIDDEEGWKQANPDLGNGRITLATLRAARESTAEATFRTERLCQWVEELDEDITPILDLNGWKRRSVTEPLRLGYRAIAVEVHPETRERFFVSVGQSALGAHAEIAPYPRDMSDDDTVAALKRFIRNNRPDQPSMRAGVVAVVVDGKTEAASLIEPCRRAGIDVVDIGYTNLAKSLVTMRTRFRDGKLTNDGNPEWLDALRTTKTRQSSSGGAELIDRYKGHPQVLAGLQLALWGLESFAPVAPQTKVASTNVVVHGARLGVAKSSAPEWGGKQKRKLGQWS